jgi:hypothetical protein
MTQNGSIADPAGVGVPADAVPTLDRWALMLLAALLWGASLLAYPNRKAPPS